MTRLAHLETGQLLQLIPAFVKAGMTMEVAQEIIADPRIMRMMLDRARHVLPSRDFDSPRKQLETFCSWEEKKDSHFTSRDGQFMYRMPPSPSLDDAGHGQFNQVAPYLGTWLETLKMLRFLLTMLVSQKYGNSGYQVGFSEELCSTLRPVSSYVHPNQRSVVWKCVSYDLVETRNVQLLSQTIGLEVLAALIANPRFLGSFLYGESVARHIVFPGIICDTNSDQRLMCCVYLPHPDSEDNMRTLSFRMSDPSSLLGKVILPRSY